MRFPKQTITLGVAAFATLLALPFATSGAPKPNTNGTASADSVLVRVHTGAGTVSLASDEALSVLGSDSRARASLIAGAAGGQNVGVAQGSATRRGQSDTASIAAKAYDVGDLLTLGLDAGTVKTAVGDEVTAAVSAKLGDIDILGGFAKLEGGSSVSETKVTADASTVTRTIKIGGLRALAIGDLLAAIGAAPFDLTCDAVEDLGKIVGVKTKQACENLGAAEDAIDAAVETIQDAKDQLLALRDELRAMLADLNAERSDTVSERQRLADQRASLSEQQQSLAGSGGTQSRDALQSQRDSLSSQRGTIAAMCTGVPLLDQVTCAATRDAQLAAIDAQISGVDAALAVVAQYEAVTAQIAAVNAQIAAVDGDLATIDLQIDATNRQIDDLSAQLDAILAIDPTDPDAPRATCKAVVDVLNSASQADPTLAGTFDDVSDDVDGACDQLAGLVRALINTPLVQMDGVEISITVIARAKNPEVHVSGTVGELTVGALEPVAVDLSVVSNAVAEVESLVGDTLDAVSKAIGLQLPLPQFEFLATSTGKGRRADGTWFATGSVTAMRIKIPAAEITLPDLDPLGILSDTISVPTLPAATKYGAAAARYGAAAGISTPSVAFDLGVFAAAGDYKGSKTNVLGNDDERSSSNTLRGRNTLPVTGVAGLGLAGPLMFAAAALIRRFTIRVK